MRMLTVWYAKFASIGVGGVSNGSAPGNSLQLVCGVYLCPDLTIISHSKAALVCDSHGIKAVRVSRMYSKR